MKKPVLIITLFLAVMNATSQVAINTNNTNPAPSAMLDVKSDSKGMLIPRMNSTQRKAISNPDVGLMVYDTDRQTIYLFDGFQWKPMMVTIDTQLPLISRGPESGATTIGFGMSVDIHGDYAIVGAPYDTAMGTAPGTAYIFAKENGTWTQQARIYPSNGTAGDNFGASVAIYGDYVVVGAPEKDISGVNRRGRAYIFKRNNRYWEQVAGLQASNGAAEDKFGSAV
ncbi:MAG TPA: FG-GAP repeat protein [Chitinophagaceae bacterium]|nr:FG-GAP repeat protein [Chitinophagaceae bacterium]